MEHERSETDLLHGQMRTDDFFGQVKQAVIAQSVKAKVRRVNEVAELRSELEATRSQLRETYTDMRKLISHVRALEERVIAHTTPPVPSMSVLDELFGDLAGKDAELPDVTFSEDEVRGWNSND